MAIDVRTITASEVEDYWAAMSIGFAGHATDGAGTKAAEHWDLDRTWAAVDGGRVCATLRTHATELTLPGGHILAVGGLTNVTVLPTHRRQGLLTRMIDRDLARGVERGEPVNILVAAEWPIYGRFGYGPAVEQAGYELLARARFVNPGRGTVAMVDADELRKVAPDLYDQHRRGQPGEIGRDESSWDRRLGIELGPGDKPWVGYRVIVRDELGTPTGFARYRIEDGWDQRRANATLVVEELCAPDPGAAARLWRYLAEVDWVTTVKAADRAVDDPLPYLVHDGRDARLTERSDFVWARILDVPAALEARRYTASGALVIEVVDPAGYASGRWALDGGPDGATCAPTDASADVTVPVATLGAIYLGGLSLGALAAAGLADEHSPDALARADAMFHTPRAPWCSTWF